MSCSNCGYRHASGPYCQNCGYRLGLSAPLVGIWVIIISILLACAARGQQPDLSNTPESEIIQMKAHAILLRKDNVQQLVTLITDLSAAQTKGARQEIDIKGLNEQVKSLNIFADQQVQARKNAEKAKAIAEEKAKDEKERADKLEASNARWRIFGHAVLACIFAFTFEIVWRFFGSIFPKSITENAYALYIRIGICLAAASGASYGVFYIITRVL